MSFATGFEGGPVFPLLFIGGTLGLTLSDILTFIPQGVGVTAGMAAVASAVFPLPLTISLLLGLLGRQTDLLTSDCLRCGNRFHNIQGIHSYRTEQSAGNTQ